MKKLVFATNNRHKVEEIKAVLQGEFQLITLSEAGINVEIEEPHDTLEANAREKALVIKNLSGLDCFAEDTGLEVEALGGQPGVRSARYSGDEADSDRNISLLLKNLEGCDNRRAQFRTVIHLVLDNEEYSFEGICKGTILAYRKGNQGFGYDPVFVPEGSQRTFAEMTLEEKKLFSHRSKALNCLLEFLSNQTLINRE
jgi:XTP/dITP diphosphohydrolase